MFIKTGMSVAEQQIPRTITIPMGMRRVAIAPPVPTFSEAFTARTYKTIL
jgi:hypothetical protein